MAKPGSRAALRKYPEELRELAIRLAVDLRRVPATKVGAMRRIGELEREVCELRRAQRDLADGVSVFAAAELDRKLK